MAELTITPGSVAKGTNAVVNNDYLAGETVTAGMVVYHKLSDSRWWKAQADGTVTESGSGAAVGPGGVGITTHGSLAGQPLQVQVSGQITIGATIAAGVHYYSTTTAGSIGLAGDLASTNYVTRVGYGASTAVLQIDIKVTGLVLA